MGNQRVWYGPARQTKSPWPWAAGNVVYLDSQVVVRILSRLLALGAPPELLQTLVAGRGNSDHGIPSDLNVELAGRTLIGLTSPHLFDISAAMPDPSSVFLDNLPLVPGLPVKLSGEIRDVRDVTMGTLILWLGDHHFRVQVRREESLHLNRAYFTGKRLRLLAVVRRVPNWLVAGLITCDER